VFARRDFDKMHVITWDGTSWGAWRDISFGGLFTASPTAVSPGPGRLEVYARGTDNLLYRNRSFDSGATWDVWREVDPNNRKQLGSSPDAVIVGGQTNVTAREQLSEGANGLWLVTH
jgi:hypothetical protein